MGTGGSNVAVVVEQKRKLTEQECLRLMGFPENYHIEKGYQAYKQIGNSIVVPVVNKLAQELVNVLNLNKKQK
jgi:DNA (cytosine-5)-methyltransferase 1